MSVARLLDKLLIEQTKSRARRTGDNGLVECKNGAIVRKHMGFSHIAAPHAETVDQFHRQYLNPYLNLHRPCAVAEIVEEPNGKRRRVYRRWATPFEIFRSFDEKMLCAAELPELGHREACLVPLQSCESDKWEYCAVLRDEGLNDAVSAGDFVAVPQICYSKDFSRNQCRHWCDSARLYYCHS